MKEYRNIFKEKTDDELTTIYAQFIESEKTGYIGNNELGIIRDEYWEYFEANTLFSLQTDLLHVITDRWYATKIK